MKVVIPAAGWGTRFLPYTKAAPKEMLPIVDKPVIQYVVEEAVRAGCSDVLIITGRGKRAVEDHFDSNPELEMLNKTKHDRAGIAAIKEISDMTDKVNIHYVRQREAAGLGNAIYCAREHVGNEPFIVLLGDTIYKNEEPVTAQLMRMYNRYKSPIISVEEVSRERIPTYGIIDGREIEKDVWEITGLVEKPSPEKAPTNLGIIGAYVLTPDIFEAIEKTKPGKNGEVQLTDALDILRKKRKMYAPVFRGRRFDIGNKLDWYKAFFELTLEDFPESDELAEHMRGVLNGRK